jgi:hypothetical protein
MVIIKEVQGKKFFGIICGFVVLCSGVGKKKQVTSDLSKGFCYYLLLEIWYYE